MRTRRAERRIKEEGWEELLVWAGAPNAPWIAYMTDDFVRRCMHLVNDSASAFMRVAELWKADPREDDSVRPAF